MHHAFNGLRKNRCIAACVDIRMATSYWWSTPVSGSRTVRQFIAANYASDGEPFDRVEAAYNFIESYFPETFDEPCLSLDSEKLKQTLHECMEEAARLEKLYRDMTGEPAFVPALMAAE